MTKDNYLLSIVADKDGDVMHLHADTAGLTALITALERLRAKLSCGECEHDHFFTEEWGGSGLTATMFASEAGFVVAYDAASFERNAFRENPFISAVF